MYGIDIFKEEREELLAKCEKEKQAAIEEGIEKGKIEALRKDVSKLLLAKFKDSYTLQMRNALNKVEEDTLNYITAHIFDISLEDVKKIFFVL